MKWRRVVISSLILAGLLGGGLLAAWNHSWARDDAASMQIPVPDRDLYLARASTADRVGGDTPEIFPGTPHSRTGPVPREHLEQTASCGLAGCHPDITRQWEQSMHHLASFNNPMYRKSVDYTRERQGDAGVRWCAGCHDPVLLMAGEIDGPITPDTPGATAGVTCLTCHATQGLQDLTGNGRYVLEVPRASMLDPGHPLGGLIRGLLEVYPEPHRRGLLKPLHKEPEFCSSCHRVGLTKAQNGFHWLRGQDQFGSWQNGGASGRVARSFYTPKQPQRCQDCHMPLVPSTDAGNDAGMVRSHAFPGGNSALPALTGYPAQAALTEAFLKGAVRVDLFAVRELEPGGEETWQVPLETARLRPGALVSIDVVVRNLRVGHAFPEGVLDNKDAWLEVVAKDASGREVWRQGGLDANLELRPESHLYTAVLLDEAGNRIDKRNIGDFRVPLFRRVLGPGASDVVRYHFRVPKETGALTLEARLCYRKVRQDYTKWVYAGKRAPGESAPPVNAAVDTSRFEIDPSIPIPVVPVVEVSRASVTVAVDPSPGRLSETSDRPEPTLEKGGESNELSSSSLPLPPGGRGQGRGPSIPLPERWHDYGVGFLLQKDSDRARRAFTCLVDQFPDDVLGHVGLARVALQVGDPDAAFTALEGAKAALERRQARGEPGSHWEANARIPAFWAQALIEKGDYDGAVKLLEPLTAQVPKDKTLWLDLGYAHFQKERLEAAVAAYERVLEIDPDDGAAFSMLARAYQALGREKEARQARQIFDALREDESVQGLRQRYLERHPEAALEAQLDHAHGPVLP